MGSQHNTPNLIVQTVLLERSQVFSEKAAVSKAPQEDLNGNNRTICSGKQTLKWIILGIRRSSPLLYLWVAQEVHHSCWGHIYRDPRGYICTLWWQDKLNILPKGSEICLYLATAGLIFSKQKVNETFLNVREQQEYTSEDITMSHFLSQISISTQV